MKKKIRTRIIKPIFETEPVFENELQKRTVKKNCKKVTKEELKQTILRSIDALKSDPNLDYEDFGWISEMEEFIELLDNDPRFIELLNDPRFYSDDDSDDLK